VGRADEQRPDCPSGSLPRQAFRLIWAIVLDPLAVPEQEGGHGELASIGLIDSWLRSGSTLKRRRFSRNGSAAMPDVELLKIARIGPIAHERSRTARDQQIELRATFTP